MKNVLYYLAFTDSSQTCVLVSFDIRSEELSMIKLPPPPGKRLALINYGGKVAVFDFSLLKENGL
uniref:F-box associated beta-propeller type 3 domain-containing protein n=5 Tax=Brassica TaxID=3705 RepID=A0A0D3AGJ9_BRAOL